MSIIKKVFLVVVVLFVVIGLSTVYATDKVIQLASPVLEKVSFIDTQQIQTFADSAATEIDTATERGQELGSEAQKVLGVAIEPSSKEQTIHEKAFEYGRYIYCQEVVKNYESHQNK